MADANFVGFIGVIITILAVGVALGGLILKLHGDTNKRIDERVDDTNKRIGDLAVRIDDTNKRIDDTNKRIDDIANRMVEVEKGQARLEGYLAGIRPYEPVG